MTRDTSTTNSTLTDEEDFQNISRSISLPIYEDLSEMVTSTLRVFSINLLELWAQFDKWVLLESRFVTKNL